MNNVNWENYNDSSLEFVYSESSKMLDETFKAFRESSNKAFIALAIYSGILSYCFNQIIKDEITLAIVPYIIMIVGMIISILLLLPNLFPRKMVVPGTLPSRLITGYFEQAIVKEKQRREMIISRLINHDEAIKQNINQAVVRARRIKQSGIIFLIFLLLSLASSIIC